MENTKSWFDSYKLGPLTLKNRVLMAPLTRMRCDKQTSIPNDLLVEYYKQRAGFGMIITECSPISKRGNTFPGAPGIYTEEQVAGWKRVIDAVHAEGGLMCIQIWHCGRAMAQGLLPEGMDCWGPSEVQVRDFDKINNANFMKPHTMTKDEIKEVIKEFRIGAENAKKAGFDAIMLHGANGYLVDQFLRDWTNKRTDEYGGSLENRCRFALEVLDELIAVFGKERTGIRLSPTGRSNDMFDSDPFPLFSYLMKKLDEKGIEFVEIKEAGNQKSWDFKNEHQEKLISGEEQLSDCCKSFRPFFSRTLINNDRSFINQIIKLSNSLTRETGLNRINEGICDLASFGRPAIANPDLPYRFKNNLNQAKPDPKYYFTEGKQGYTDYPTYEEEQKQA